MLIPLNIPNNFRYIYINRDTNRIHLLVPFCNGVTIATDNTCKANASLIDFFGRTALIELESYQSMLNFHLQLLDTGNELYRTRKKQLEQIDMYIKAVKSMRDNYQIVADRFLSKPSNLYGIQLRPKAQDPISGVIHPVFTINRKNDASGTPSSPLYNKIHEVFPKLDLQEGPRSALIQKVKNSLPENAPFEDIQNTLKKACIDLFKMNIDVEKDSNGASITKAYIDSILGNDNLTVSDYTESLLGLCALNLFDNISISTFYSGSYTNKESQTESLSIKMQFYLGILNVYCRAKGISEKNFGEILDASPSLSNELVDIVADALGRSDEVEHGIINFFNIHKKEFNLSRELNAVDKDAITQQFEVNYRTVTTGENAHMDDFRILDTEIQDEDVVFISNKGSICTDASHIIPITQENRVYLNEIRREAHMLRHIITPQDESDINIDISPETLLDKFDIIQWDKLPKDVVDSFLSSPLGQQHLLLDNVAKGKQNEAHTILQSSEDKQRLLLTPGKFTDYSGRIFRCTAYEYAYWAKDTHMQRMLESHMDATTKAYMLENINKMEKIGLAYEQHGKSYRNAHYDMSFVLKNLSVSEFRQLKSMVGKNIDKIEEATDENYQEISFTATEFEHLKKELVKLNSCCSNTISFFKLSPAQKLSNKLKDAFDFDSLIIALENYVIYRNNHFGDGKNNPGVIKAWLKVGKAQRDVPAYVAQEYCKQNRMFSKRHLPSLFNEENLPRTLAFVNAQGEEMQWFPLISDSGLGFDFAVTNSPSFLTYRATGWTWANTDQAESDLAAMQRLDELRINDLSQSQNNLSQPANQLGLS